MRVNCSNECGDTGPLRIALTTYGTSRWVRMPAGFRKRRGPDVMAALRNAAIGLLRTGGVTNIAEALRRHASQVGVIFSRLGILKQ